ncbi:hypothetical protein FJT64_007249 [Amphibalanus amphitrite]|uniref:Odorant receptor n=1 Tax=Amphibalanus amphitrite TaxID=1232801 RepID=A0A6A4VFB6_AMPAM|nr:hypothetical protein FJT64_007249 [Amphibalanus amphitrite]
MWHHSRLLRAVLLLSSLLSLAGLHVSGPTSPDGWRAARLVPLTFTALSALGNLAYVATSGSSRAALAAMPFGVLALHATLVLVHLFRRRRQLHAILDRAVSVQRATAFCREHGDFSWFQWRLGILCFITVSTITLWLAAFLLAAELKPPYYLYPMLLPETLRGLDFYWVILGLQMAASVMSFTIQSTFDVLQMGLADAVSVAQIRLTRYVSRLVASTTPASGDLFGDFPAWSLDKAPANGGKDAELAVPAVAAEVRASVTPFRPRKVGAAEAHWSPAVSRDFTKPGVKTLSQKPHSAAPAAPDNQQTTGGTHCRHTCPTLPAPDGDLHEGLRLLAGAYRSVRELATESAELCSLPTLTQHASVTLVLLIGVYVAIDGSKVNTALVFGSFVLFLLLNTLRLMAVSVTGSRLIDSGEALSAALVATSWPRPLPAQLQFEVIMLVEGTRKPIMFDGYGIFVPQKETLLSLLSFILTYFVIMIQIGL